MTAFQSQVLGGNGFVRVKGEVVFSSFISSRSTVFPPCVGRDSINSYISREIDQPGVLVTALKLLYSLYFWVWVIS